MLQQQQKQQHVLCVLALRHPHLPEAQQPSLTPNIDTTSPNIHQCGREPVRFYQRVDLRGGGTACTCSMNVAAIFWHVVNIVNTRQTGRPHPPDSRTTRSMKMSFVVFYVREFRSIGIFSTLCETLQWLHGLRDGARVSSRVCGSIVKHQP